MRRFLAALSGTSSLPKLEIPKLEIQSPRSERNPKAEARRGGSSRSSGSSPSREPAFGGRPVLRNTPTEIAVHSGATAEGGLTRISFFRISGFGTSDFPHAHIPLKTANTQ